MRGLVALVLQIMPLQVFAAQLKTESASAVPVSPLNMSSIFQVVAALLVILLLIIAISWLYRKYGFKYGMSGESIKVISAISLGGKEKAVLLQVGNEQILLGVSPGYVRKVHILTDPVSEIKENNSGNFISKLNKEISKVISK